MYADLSTVTQPFLLITVKAVLVRMEALVTLLLMDFTVIVHHHLREKLATHVSMQISLLLAKNNFKLCHATTAAVIAAIRPRIITQPQNITGVLYSTVSLLCLAEGYPQPEIHWFKRGSRLPTDRVTSNSFEIAELELNDRGFYYCEAVNSAGTVRSHTVLINVEGWDNTCIAHSLMQVCNLLDCRSYSI